MGHERTTKMWFDDPELLGFEARVMAVQEQLGTVEVELDQTAFFPESGGQPADHGTMGTRRVIDVQIGDDGRIVHTVDGPPPVAGERVSCQVDGQRRRLHRALHTGQHLLSQAFVRVLQARTISSHLGESGCTLDVGCREVSRADLLEVEQLVNDIIDEDRPVRAFVAGDAELGSLALRRKPKVKEKVRVVVVDDFEAVACGGTHCSRTSQVGLLRVLGSHVYKGHRRVQFEAGSRARRALSEQSETLLRLGRDLTCGPLDVPRAVASLKTDLARAKERAARASSVVARALADDYLRHSTGPVVSALVPEGDEELMKALAKRITTRPDKVALLFTETPDALILFCLRGEESDFDCGAFVKATTTEHGGRGGGRAVSGQGSLPPRTDWRLIAARAGTRR